MRTRYVAPLASSMVLSMDGERMPRRRPAPLGVEADHNQRLSQPLAQDFGRAPRLALEHALAAEEAERDDVGLPDAGLRWGETELRRLGRHRRRGPRLPRPGMRVEAKGRREGGKEGQG